ncbi:general stress protein [Trichococcus alkaliphilus]|uniref:general stress protein n=1 Tax=Trichococcus alkaliphilus TaxID=2052943 RepID=UPI001374E697|nr:general stress protein [Trichococcus alkaliphilus]
MDKRIEGTFANQEMVIDEITHLIKHEGYAPEQLLVITRNGKSNYITEETAVQVIITGEDREEDSLWDKIVKFFTVDLDEEEEETIFERYGIDEDTYERFEDALDDGELLLLIDDAAPINDEHAEFLVRDGILPDEKVVPVEAVTAVTATKPDWTPAESEEVGDVPAHSIEAAKKIEGTEAEVAAPTQPADVTDDIMGQPIETEITTVAATKPDWTPVDSEEVGEVPAHFIDDAKKLEATEVSAESPTQPADLIDDITGQPIEAEKVADPMMAEDNQKLPEMQFDEDDSLVKIAEEKEQFSKDPFGGDTVVAAAGEDAEDIEPDYDETDKPKPAL